MATPNNTTPDSSDSENLTPSSEPMIIDGKVVDGAPSAESRAAEYNERSNHFPDADSSVEQTILPPAEAEDADGDDAPAPPPRNAMAQIGMLAGVGSLIINPYGVMSLVAIVVSFIGLRRSIAMFKSGEVPVGRIPATIGLAFGVATAVFAAWIIFTNPTVS
ncbi:hypothetical protein [Demequina aurantiaca]|uniref:hypothetical protein n=1 Tax=Demequina aurantiaca TaxID=676200 RepID=UPI0007862307|nr:hypothetical protein [Demequina aurantiaca]